MNCFKLGWAISKGCLPRKDASPFSLFTYYGRTIFTSNYRNVHTTTTSNSLKSSKQDPDSVRARTVRNYAVAVTILTLGLSYAAVPLYTIFCQMTGYGGTTKQMSDGEVLRDLKKVTNRKIKVKFNSDVGASMAWEFKPQQYEIEVAPGETALAFYTATNPTDRPIIGVSTYNVIPFEAGLYFNKIQCFCFEEQMLNPHEQVDMPVFFYIDPGFVEDPSLENVSDIILSYTFFESKEGLDLPVPGFLKNQ